MTGSVGSHLVLERAGQLWAVPGAAVEHLERGEGRLTVLLSARSESAGSEVAALFADRLLAVAAGLAVRPAPRVIGRWWNEATVGLALFDRRPVVVIDPARPPRVLVSETGEDGDG